MIGLLQYLQTICLSVSLLFLALLFVGLSKRRCRHSDRKPKVSVLVAARNDEKDLPQLLADLEVQDYPRDRCEFVLIDDASNDGTGALMDEWVDRDQRFKSVHLEETTNRSMGPKKRALAAGFKVSNGEIILTTDADCQVQPGWISTLVACFDDETSAVCGYVRALNSRGFWSRLSAFENVANNILNAAVIGIGGALSCLGANFAYRREIFLEVGGFDLDCRSMSGDDDLLLQKIKSRGGKIRFCDDPAGSVNAKATSSAKAHVFRKRRHLSAGKRYALHWIILAALIYLGCFTSVLLAIIKIFGASLDYNFIIKWGIFSLSLLLVFYRGVRRLNESGWLHWAVPTAVLFPVTFTLIQPLTLFPSPAWKGRSSRLTTLSK